MFRSHIAIPNHKTNSECSGSGLASFMMILVESNIIVLGLARMNVCIVGKYIKFNDEIIYYRHLTYYIDSVNLKMVIFPLGNS